MMKFKPYIKKKNFFFLVVVVVIVFWLVLWSTFIIISLVFDTIFFLFGLVCFMFLYDLDQKKKNFLKKLTGISNAMHEENAHADVLPSFLQLFVCTCGRARLLVCVCV